MTPSSEILSPLDGRYSEQINKTRKVFSNFSLSKSRLQVEILWLIECLKAIDFELKNDEVQKMKSIFIEFSETDYQKVLQIESEINHDIKAIENFAAQKLQAMQLQKFIPFLHFGLTSEDVDTTAYALVLMEAKQDYLTTLKEFTNILTDIANKYTDSPILSLTHGQPATPTTFGKEMVNFLSRIDYKSQQIQNHKLQSKIACATGNFQALHHSYPDVDWMQVSSNLITSLNMQPNLFVTQILPKENWLDLLFHTNAINLILLDFSKDMWGYIQRAVLGQISIDKEVGSSTMPHKVNPINFENAEGNLSLANQLFTFFNNKITQSRFQRDLSDKTSLRNLGLFYGYSILGLKSVIKGLKKIQLNKIQAQKELSDHPEVLTELIQTILRKHNQTTAYQKLKEFSRGKKITISDLHNLIQDLDLPQKEKQILNTIHPEHYIGLASKLTKIFLNNQNN